MTVIVFRVCLKHCVLLYISEVKLRLLDTLCMINDRSDWDLSAALLVSSNTHTHSFKPNLIQIHFLSLSFLLIYLKLVKERRARILAGGRIFIRSFVSKPGKAPNFEPSKTIEIPLRNTRQNENHHRFPIIDSFGKYIDIDRFFHRVT